MARLFDGNKRHCLVSKQAWASTRQKEIAGSPPALMHIKDTTIGGQRDVRADRRPIMQKIKHFRELCSSRDDDTCTMALAKPMTVFNQAAHAILSSEVLTSIPLPASCAKAHRLMRMAEWRRTRTFSSASESQRNQLEGLSAPPPPRLARARMPSAVIVLAEPVLILISTRLLN